MKWVLYDNDVKDLLDLCEDNEVMKQEIIWFLGEIEQRDLRGKK